MEEEIQKTDLGNPLRNLVGWNNIKKPSDKKILEKILEGMADVSNETCWNPIKSVEHGKAVSFTLMLKQCPGACGRVWSIVIKDKDVAKWLVNEINKRRHGS